MIFQTTVLLLTPVVETLLGDKIIHGEALVMLSPFLHESGWLRAPDRFLSLQTSHESSSLKYSFWIIVLLINVIRILQSLPDF